MKPDSTIFLWVLENKVSFIGQVNDPWFRAVREDLNGNTTVWKSDETVGVIGCAEYYEFCNTTRCLDPLSIPVRAEHFPGLDALNYNEKQNATFLYMRRAALYGRAYIPPMLLQDELLLARPQVFQDPIFGGSGISLDVPDNQWELEVDNLFNTSLAFLQHMAVEHASQSNIPITPNRTLWDFIIRDEYPGADYVCQNQMIRSTAYSSLSVVGLGCILGIGGMFIVLSLTLPSITPWLCVRVRKHNICQQDVEWQGNGLLLLHLRALEGHGSIRRVLDQCSLVPLEKDKQFSVPWLAQTEESALEFQEQERNRQSGRFSDGVSSDEQQTATVSG